MKKVLSVLFGTMLLASSCSSEYYQIVDVKSSLPVKNNNYVYDDGSCRITYDFWGNGGNPGFRIENLTDKVLYLDLSNSFYVENGMAYDYYKCRTYTNSKSSTSGKSASVSGSVVGVWAKTLMLGSKTATSAVSETNSSMSGVSVLENKVIGIPPHSSKLVSEYAVLADVIQDCSVNLRNVKNSNSRTFSKDESPKNFSNYITYSIGQEGEKKSVVNDFYVSGISNYRKKDVLTKEKAGCKSQLKFDRNKLASPSKFYVKYNNMHNRNFSADAPKSYDK